MEVGAMKIQYTEFVNVLHAPQAALPALADLNAVESNAPGVKFTIDVRGNVRNRDGFRTAFARDIAKLRSLGCIFEPVLTKEGLALVQAGKIDAKTHQAIKPETPALATEHTKARKA